LDKRTISSIFEVVNELFPKDTSIAVSDEKQFIYYKPSKQVDLKIKPGDIVKVGTITHKALEQQHKISEQINNSDVFGMSYFGTSVPILDSGNMKGCVTAVLPAKPTEFLANFITIKTGDRWIPLQYEQIFYLEAENRKTKIQSVHGEGIHKYNLTELEMILPTDSFIRCHRSYIVNVHYIAEIHPDSHSTFLLIMKDKKKIPVSQTYSRYFRHALQF